MKKTFVLIAALLASGVALLSTAAVNPRPPPAQEAPVDMSGVERHLAQVLRTRLNDLQEERAWALGLR